MSKFTIAVLAVFVAGLLGLAVFQTEKEEQPKLGQSYESQGRDHLQNENEPHEDYNSDIPTSGPHSARPAPWGVAQTPVNDETFVHNLEHGGIVIAYQPNLPEGQIEELRDIAQNIKAGEGSKKGFKVLLTPRPANSRPIQLAAWRYSLALDSVDEGKITQFYRDHLNNAPEAGAI